MNVHKLDQRPRYFYRHRIRQSCLFPMGPWVHILMKTRPNMSDYSAKNLMNGKQKKIKQNNKSQ